MFIFRYSDLLVDNRKIFIHDLYLATRRGGATPSDNMLRQYRNVTDRQTDRIAISISHVSVLTRDKNAASVSEQWGAAWNVTTYQKCIFVLLTSLFFDFTQNLKQRWSHAMAVQCVFSTASQHQPQLYTSVSNRTFRYHLRQFTTWTLCHQDVLHLWTCTFCYLHGRFGTGWQITNLQTSGKTSMEVANCPGIQTSEGAKCPCGESSRYRSAQVANRLRW